MDIENLHDVPPTKMESPRRLMETGKRTGGELDLRGIVDPYLYRYLFLFLCLY